jgi:hypothetical protein
MYVFYVSNSIPPYAPQVNKKHEKNFKSILGANTDVRQWRVNDEKK